MPYHAESYFSQRFEEIRHFPSPFFLFCLSSPKCDTFTPSTAVLDRHFGSNELISAYSTFFNYLHFSFAILMFFDGKDPRFCLSLYHIFSVFLTSALHSVLLFHLFARLKRRNEIWTKVTSKNWYQQITNGKC